MISPIRAGQLIIELAEEEGRALTQLQILKLVYIAHGWHLATYGEPLLNEKVQAWQYGPVVPSLYHSLKRFGTGLVPKNWLRNFLFAGRDPTPEEEESLATTYRMLGKFSGIALSNLTHKPGSPWSKVWRPGVADLVIPNDIIRQHYLQVKQSGSLTAA